MGKRILVHGWYGHANVGDELMAAALRHILAGHVIKFVDKLKLVDVQTAQVVLIGGGSFLYAPLHGDEATKVALASKPVIYVGVGSETDIHDEHVKLLKRSTAAFTRSKTPSAAFLAAAPHAVTLPDLSLCLNSVTNQTPMSAKKLLVVPNSEVLPHRSAPSYKRPAWEYFKSEACQAIDALVSDGWSVSMAPFCDDAAVRDVWACAEITANCERRAKIRCLTPEWIGDGSFDSISKVFADVSVVLTQRFHGAIIAQLTGTPCVIIHHHDKLKQLGSEVATKVPYYGVQKDMLLDSIKNAQVPVNSTDPGLFAIVRDAVNIALDE